MRFWAIIFTTLIVCFALLAVFAGPDVFKLSCDIAELRMGRSLVALLTGAALGAVGCALQALFRNPLADPYIMGVSGGSALGGALAVACGLFGYAIAIPSASIVAALLASAFLGWTLKRVGAGNNDRVLLIGIAFNTFASSLITLLKVMLEPAQAQLLLYWLVGNIEAVELSPSIYFTVAVLAGLIPLILLRGPIMLLSMGNDEARRLGVNVEWTQAAVYLLSSCLIGVVVSMTGMIGFVGLLIPNALRHVLTVDYRILLPLSALLGALVLLICDTLARLSFYVLYTELPVGVLTALLGAPVFAWLLLRKQT